MFFIGLASDWKRIVAECAYSYHFSLGELGELTFREVMEWYELLVEIIKDRNNELA